MSLTKKLGIGGALIAVVFGCYVSAMPAQAEDATIKMTPEIVRDAGFTNPKAVTTTSTRYMPPLFYFTVTEKVAGTEGQAWGNVANLVSVLIRPVVDKTWVFNKGEPEIKTLSGRTQINLASPGYYISVTGPDADKVRNLAERLKVLY